MSIVFIPDYTYRSMLSRLKTVTENSSKLLERVLREWTCWTKEIQHMMNNTQNTDYIVRY